MVVKRPALIGGEDLKAYILNQRKARKSKSGLDTIYGVSCRQQRKPAGRMADCILKGNRAALTALCEVCENMISKLIAAARIPDIARTLDSQQRGVKRHSRVGHSPTGISTSRPVQRHSF